MGAITICSSTGLDMSLKISILLLLTCLNLTMADSELRLFSEAHFHGGIETLSGSKTISDPKAAIKSLKVVGHHHCHWKWFNKKFHQTLIPGEKHPIVGSHINPPYEFVKICGGDDIRVYK